MVGGGDGGAPGYGGTRDSGRRGSHHAEDSKIHSVYKTISLTAVAGGKPADTAQIAYTARPRFVGGQRRNAGGAARGARANAGVSGRNTKAGSEFVSVDSCIFGDVECV